MLNLGIPLNLDCQLIHTKYTLAISDNQVIFGKIRVFQGKTLKPYAADADSVNKALCDRSFQTQTHRGPAKLGAAGAGKKRIRDCVEKTGMWQSDTDTAGLRHRAAPKQSSIAPRTSRESGTPACSAPAHGVPAGGMSVRGEDQRGAGVRHLPTFGYPRAHFTMG